MVRGSTAFELLRLPESVTPSLYVVGMLLTSQERVDSFKAELYEINARISQLQARQLTLLNQLERSGVARAEGARSMVDWTATTMDVTPATARQHVTAANLMYRKDPLLFEDLEAGRITLDRATATLRLMSADAPMGVVDRSRELDLSQVNRLTHRFRRISRKDEAHAFADRYFTIQPSLDNSRWSGRFELPAVEGQIVDQAIAAKTDGLHRQPGADHYTRGQLQADALVMISQDSLARDADGGGGGSQIATTIFVDIDRANDTAGELGAELAFGPRVGPAVLEEVLCSGSVRLVGLENGEPIVTSQSASAISPAVRDFVAWRDGRCTVAGCTSRYRLQPHHVKHRAHGGGHGPGNLATLCWFHHHVAIHHTGFTLHADDPPECRRLIPPNRSHDPPW